MMSIKCCQKRSISATKTEGRSTQTTELPVDPYPPSIPSEKPELFRQRFYPNATADQWNDWHWQFDNRITTFDQLRKIINLSPEETEALIHPINPLPVSITPYYASLIDPDNSADPLRRCVVPVLSEREKKPGEAEDPLNEDEHSPIEGLVHRYPDRVLFLATPFCSTNCRYCTRSRMVGHEKALHWEKAFKYIREHTEIRDVLISGGDPLTLPGEVLERILSQIRAIEHVEMIRIGTKVPMVLPQRVNTQLTNMLKKYHPLLISVHATHPQELTPETVRALTMLADAGIPLGSQTVLLAGINDDPVVMKKLMHGLLRARVRPYYLYQCDPIVGSAHFRTTVQKGLEIIQSLRGWTSGYAIPTYVIDAPGGGGKIPISPNYVVGSSENGLELTNYMGGKYIYPDNGSSTQ
jgi:lysine 2,3-aminomutase